MTDKEFGKAWIDLAQPRLGTEVVHATDDFFAPKERLISPESPIFVPDKFDDHGKWMDGWESRRRRGGGYDYCVIRLGCRGIVKGIDIDTSHFTGNYPPEASIEMCVSDRYNPDTEDIWYPLVERRPLGGNSHHLIGVDSQSPISHLRLNIFPDGGVARLRVFGVITPDWHQVPPGEAIDLAAMVHGGRPIACNDEHFGSLANLIAPGKGINMGDGWETRRRREPGHDWGILALGAPGIIEQVLIDTAYFKGNYPDRFYLQGMFVEGDPAKIDLKAAEEWPVLLEEQKLEMDREHLFSTQINRHAPINAVRLNIIPDGGVSRLRLFGRRVDTAKSATPP